MGADPLDLRLGPAIHPDQAGMQRLEVGVDRDAGAAVEARDAQRFDVVAAACDLGDAALHGVEPYAGMLFGPVGRGVSGA